MFSGIFNCLHSTVPKKANKKRKKDFFLIYFKASITKESMYEGQYTSRGSRANQETYHPQAP